MKFHVAILASLACFSSLVFAQEDGPSGDGGCDPCDENCDIFSKRELKSTPRMLEYNDTSEWEEGEVMRWRKPASEPAAVTSRFAKRVPPGGVYTLQFNCGNVPEICLNMCYGFNCKGLPDTLTIQRSGCAAARKSNKCGMNSPKPNYCSTKVTPNAFAAGYSCDEYPFASTAEGSSAAGNAATRCVPKGQNSSQGGTISGLYKNGAKPGMLPDGTAFKIDIMGYSSGYCNTSPNCGTQTGDANSKGSQE